MKLKLCLLCIILGGMIFAFGTVEGIEDTGTYVIDVATKKPPARPSRLDIRPEDLAETLWAEVEREVDQQEASRLPVRQPQPERLEPVDEGKTKETPISSPPQPERLEPADEEKAKDVFIKPVKPEKVESLSTFKPELGPPTEDAPPSPFPQDTPPTLPTPKLDTKPRSDTQRANLHYDLAMDFYASGDIEAAVAEFRNAMVVDSLFITPARRAKIHYDFGIEYHRRGDLGAAMDQYQKAIYYDDEFAPAHANLGAIYLRMGAREEAAREFRRAKEIEANRF